MTCTVPAMAQSIVRRALALFGAAGLLGLSTPVPATATPQRAALEARVAEMRRHLDQAGDAGLPAVPATLIAQAAKWNNWPNWSNWANWRNA